MSGRYSEFGIVADIEVDFVDESNGMFDHLLDDFYCPECDGPLELKDRGYTCVECDIVVIPNE